MMRPIQVLLIFSTAWIGIVVPTIVGVGDGCSESKDCILPEEPNNVTKYHKVNEGSNIGYSFLNINITCSLGYELHGPDSYDCFNGCWHPPFNSTCIQIQRPSPDCYLPKHPSVEYKCFDQKSKHSWECNEYVAQGIVVKPHCREPSSDETLRPMNCTNGKWNYIATCDTPQPGPTCYLPKHPTVEYQCFGKNSNNIGECKEYVPQGIVVKPLCRKPLFRASNTLVNMYCENGKWDHIATCEPECGTMIPNGKPLSIKGRDTYDGEVPWHAGIYYTPKKPYALICGGSLISRNIVISAAHCFYNNKKKEDPENFSVAVGKQYKDWNDIRDKEPQKSPIQAIHIPPRFQGAWTQNQADIAIVEVVNKFQYVMHVRPLCISFEETIPYYIQNGTMEKVAGWGYTSVTGSQPSRLQVIDMPYVDIGTCIKNMPDTYHKYLLEKKFCAGYINESKTVCQGDSGGGLAFPVKRSPITRYYLHGIVSTQPNFSDKKCEPNYYATFTNVLEYKDFILEYLKIDYPIVDNRVDIEARSSINDNSEAASVHAISSYLKPWRSISGNCVLPDYPENGQYVPIFPNAKPGDTFDFVSYHVTCDQGYDVISAGSDRSGNVYCYNGTWFPRTTPECEKLCHLKQHHSVEYRCLVMETNNEYRECKEYEPSGAIVKPICREPVYTSDSVFDRMRCEGGKWNYKAVCKPKCGVLSRADRRNSDNKDVSKGHSRIPWGAYLYTKTETPYKFICGGTLISNNLVITAAHCVQDSSRIKIPEFNFGIAVGLTNINWGMRHEWEQLSEVKSTHIVSDGKTAVDVALIVATKPFKYYAQVQPLCVDFERRLYRGYVGKINGIPLRTTLGNEFVRDIKMHYMDLDNCINPHSNMSQKNMLCAWFDDEKTRLAPFNGSGLAFPDLSMQSDMNDQYYLEGVFSKIVSPNVVLYTRLYNLKKSIKSLMQKYIIND